MRKKVREFAERRGLEEPLITSRIAQDRLFPILFDCAIFPYGMGRRDND